MWGLLAGIACAPSPDPPRLVSVAPSHGWTGENTDISLSGENFYPEVVLGSGGRLDDSFLAWLETSPETPLDAVNLLDDRSLGAQVPAGLTPGTYDVRVEAPSGATATLTNGFTVTETKADHLGLSAATAAYDAGTTATVTVSLLDPEASEVREAMAVEVWVESSRVDSGASMAGTTLGDATALDSVPGYDGWLGADGKATIDVTTTLDEELYVYARPTQDLTVDEAAPYQLSFHVGDLAQLQLDGPGTVTAGTPFDLTVTLMDAAGNLSTDAQVVTLVENDACGSTDVSFHTIEGGSGTVNLEYDTACPTASLVARVGLIVSPTFTFTVEPGPLAGYGVVASPTALVAGSQPVTLSITAIDGWGNPISDVSGSYTVTASNGELTGYTGCDPLAFGYGECSVPATLAGTDITWTVVDGTGMTGASHPGVTVAAGPAISAIVLPTDLHVKAGEPFDVVVSLVDSYGNDVAYSPGDANPVTFTDDTGTVACTWLGKEGDDELFSCTVTAATDGTLLSAEVGPTGVSGTAADAVQVDNGPLSIVDVDAGTDPRTAGTPFPVELDGFDAYGNRYVVQTDPALVLDDETGTLGPTSATLDATGSVTVDVTITTALADDHLSVSQGAELGYSASFDVVAADATSLDVETPTWVEVGEPLGVHLVARDPYGNVATGYADTVAVAGSNVCGLSTAPAFDAGEADVTLTCASVYLDETVLALAAGGLTGTSADFDVVDFDCAAGPTADLRLEGTTEPVVCLIASAIVVDADASGSVAGTAPLHAYHFSDSDGAAVETTATSTTLTYTEGGTRTVDLVVVDRAGCGAEATGLVYVGDGAEEPAGPVVVTLSASTFTEGDAPIDVDVAADDCTGDVAADESLYVRADLGETDVALTGAGAVLVLDGTGSGAFTWDPSAGYAGDATLFLGSTSGGAFGSATTTVIGDNVRPHVVDVSPSGTTSGTVSSLTVTFDEALRTSAPAGTVTLTGPSGDVPLSFTISDATVTITPTTPFDAGAGTYTLVLGDDLRDLGGGNRLDGTWSGTRSSFSVELGAVADDAPDVASCAVDTSTFTPDGDPGAGAEADSVTLTPTAASVPTWWRLDVTDSAGTLVHSTRSAGTATSLSWDGRGDDGFVAPAGRYTATVVAIDAHGNLGAGCAQTLTLTQHVEPP